MTTLPTYATAVKKRPDANDGYTTVRRKPRKVTIGKSKEHGKTNLLQSAPEPRRYAFVYRVAKTVTVDNMKDYLKSEYIRYYDVECMSNEDAKFKSFKLEIPKTSVDKVFNPETWPENIYVRKFIMPKQIRNSINSNNGSQ
jgi:hypothetical protein